MRTTLGRFLRLRKRALSLRVVIALTVVAGVTLAGALAYLNAAERLQTEYTAELRQDLQRLSTLTAMALREALWNYASTEAESIIEAAQVNPEVRAIQIEDMHGRVFAQSHKSNDDAGERISTTQDIVRAGVPLGRLTISMSTNGYKDRLRAESQNYARAVLLTLVGALLFILAILQWRLILPLKHLLLASQQLARGELNQPIGVDRNDEIGALARSLERTRSALLDLFAKVEQRNAALQDANEHLEQRVQERTQSLAQALQSLNHAQDEIIQAEKLASLGRVVAGIAHELNTPLGNALTIASTMVDLHDQLRQEDRSGSLRHSTLRAVLDRAENGFDILVRNLERASTIVRDFKQVAVDQTSNQRRSFDLGVVTGEVLTLLGPTLRKAHITIDLTCDAEVQCDSFPGPYGQVLNNLVMNAVLHGLADCAQGSVQVRVQRLGLEQARLSVADQGCGMDEEVRRRMFDPFFTTKMGRGGTGLGLNIVQGIVVRVLGGSISVDSAPGQGTTFYVTFPLTAPSLERRPGESQYANLAD